MSVSLTPQSIRTLSAYDLGYDHSELAFKLPVATDRSDIPEQPVEMSPVPSDDTIYLLTQDLLERYGGIIFTGPSGTGKSYYARRIALALVDGDPDRCRFVQFHPSYQYEDFMEGFRPRATGDGFELQERHFVELCRRATDDSANSYVLVIDEFSRGDPGRIFGESLTYLESSKRGMPFHLASGRRLVVPHNLVILATMNPLDYGAENIDAAFDRRFAKIRMEPDSGRLLQLLESAGMQEDLADRVVEFFEYINSSPAQNP